ncbi:hypothetical protein U27_02424 [Candidatus Vecturithrix granuli]|uniref:Uncharacterized protein n=1 Tax=Vecturithrix granuli TaxID=1499967 RepID=A0A0S6WC58_VECG1|nr:hypothetical protein U27_02424 [Candidatus Vecturithrix granuli]
MKHSISIAIIWCVVILFGVTLAAEELTVSADLREKLLQYAIGTLCGFVGTEDILKSAQELTQIVIVNIDENESGITHFLSMTPRYIKDGREYPQSQLSPSLIFSVDKKGHVFFSGMFFSRGVEIVVRERKIVGRVMYSIDTWEEYGYAEGRFSTGNGNIAFSDGS